MEETVLEHDTLFENVFAKSHVYLKFVGLKLDYKDKDRSFINRLRYRPMFILISISFNMDVAGQLTWLIGGFINGNREFIEVTFILPCLLISLLSFVKSFQFLKNVHHIQEIICTLKKLKTKRYLNRRQQEKIFESNRVKFLNTAHTIIISASVLGITAFAVGPLLWTAKVFYNTGEIKLFFPFLFYYPFNAYDIRVYPFLYAQQIWSVLVTLSVLWGSDYICYAMTTYIIIHYNGLKQDIINLIPKSRNRQLFVANEMHRGKFTDILHYHNDLLRCAKLMEDAYTKTILVNVVFSSTLICCNVFNITANNDITVRVPCTAFLAIVLGQIFLLCYFGDMLMRSSMEVSDAIYQCRWYIAEPAIVRDLIIINLRANKPCKLTAYGFSDVTLRTFTKILSTSWSYLALLQTVYNKNKLSESNT